MTKKELLKQLHNLRETIKPEANWKSANREILVSQIKAQTSETASRKILWHGLLVQKFFASAYKPLGALILIVGIVLGGYTMTVGATKNSLPGDFLYPIKLTGERMQVNLASNDEKKANLEIEFAQRRLDEMQQVAATSGSDSSKKENMQVSLQKYQESINNVKSSLSKLEKTDTATAIKVAKMVDEKTQNYVEILKDQQKNSPEVTKAADTTDAITASKSMSEKALDMIINEYNAGSSEVTMDMVIQKLEKKLADLYTALDKDGKDLDTIIVNMALAKQLEASAAALASAKTGKALADKKMAEAVSAEEVKPVETVTATDETKPEATNENTNANSNANINAVILEPTPVEAPAPIEVLPIPEVVKSRLVEIRNLLAKANGYLSTKEVLLSYARMKDAQAILDIIEKVIEANKQYLKAPQTDTPPVQSAADSAPAVNANTNTAPEVKK